jgi:uncharacterized circularly permuted ATP-grasp superfamily protein
MMDRDAAAQPSRAFDEMQEETGIRPAYAGIAAWIAQHGLAALGTKRTEADALFRRVGITFAVHGEGGDPERLIPFDVIPRILARSEWDRLARGLTQRVRALNAFIGDVYAGQEIVRAGRVPAALLTDNEAFCKPMLGFRPPTGVFTHTSGIDLVRTGPDDFYVLEDNCRTPSGVSYMLENREAMLRLFPGLCSDHRLAPVGHYPEELLETLKEAAPPNCTGRPCVAISPPTISTAPITSTASWPMRWAWRWWKAPTSSCTTTWSTCAPPPDRNGWTCCTAAWMTTTSTRTSSSRRACSACPASSPPIARATSRWPTRRVPASPTTRRSIPSCRR